MQELGKILIGFLSFAIIVAAILEVAPTAGSFVPNFGENLSSIPLILTPKSEEGLSTISAKITPSGNLQKTPAPSPRAEISTQTPAVYLSPTPKAEDRNFSFDDSVPSADSPEFSADGMQACFSMYTRTKNEAHNTCKGEWYPVDQVPNHYDEYWCATNSGQVGWVPARLYDGRGTLTVKPYGSLNQCN